MNLGSTQWGALFSTWRGAASKLVQTLEQPVWRSTAFNLGLIALWYSLSTVLSIYNKTLLGKDHGLLGKGAFPAPLLMSAVQFLIQFLLAKVVFLSKVVERRTDGGLDWPSYWKIVVPNGVVTGVDIGFSNKSLVYITMSFYTMCKSTVPIFLLACAFIWRIERPSWELAGVVSVITVGLVLLVEGEAEFDLLGFILVMSASAMSGLRFTLTQVSLHGHGGAASLGGPLEVLELLTPIMSASTLVLSLCWERLWSVLPSSPYLSTPQQALSTLAIVGVGALLAFLMVWTEYKVIKETSALTFMIAGTCKEVVTVVVAVLVFGDRFGAINGVGLGIVILGVVLFNVHKYRRMLAGGAGIGSGHQHGSPKGVDGRGADEEQELVPLIVASSNGQHSHSSAVQSHTDKRAGDEGPALRSAGGGVEDLGANTPSRAAAPPHVLVLGAGTAILSPSVSERSALLAPIGEAGAVVANSHTRARPGDQSPHHPSKAATGRRIYPPYHAE